MDKRLKMLTALTVITIMAVAIVYASYWIYSNVRPFATAMNIILDTPTQVGGDILLTAAVTGFTPNSGKIVQFGNCTGDTPSDSNFVFIGQNTTDADGKATFQFTPINNATYRFVARTSIPWQFKISYTFSLQEL